MEAYRRDVIRREKTRGIPARVSYAVSEVRCILRSLKTGTLPRCVSLAPDQWDAIVHDEHVKAVPSLMLLVERYRDAYQTAINVHRHAIETAPIDDEAWAKELKWR